MNSEIANQPIINSFTISVLKIIRNKKRRYEQKHIVNTDLIPRFSEKMNIDHFKESSFLIKPLKQPTNLNQIKILDQPIEKPKQIEKQIHYVQRPIQQQIQPKLKPIPPKIQQPQKPVQQVQPSGKVDGWAKLSVLLNDPSVSTIECSGAGKNLTVIRIGERQITKINLNTEEIKDFLEKTADKARVPLLEGVFRVAVDNFFVNAVVSDIIGGRFIIKKQTPYSILEGNIQQF